MLKYVPLLYINYTIYLRTCLDQKENNVIFVGIEENKWEEKESNVISVQKILN